LEASLSLSAIAAEIGKRLDEPESSSAAAEPNTTVVNLQDFKLNGRSGIRPTRGIQELPIKSRAFI
jgi:hypothetical protein